MNGSISSLRKRLDAFIREYSKTKIKVVNRKDLLERTRALVKEYFIQDRPVFLQQCQDRATQPLDASMQNLIAYCNAKTSKTKYIKELKTAKKELGNLEIKCLVAGSNLPAAEQSMLSKQDNAIIDTLNKLCSNACASYIQGLHDLLNKKRYSWRGTVTEFREGLRETLDCMAPDADITAQPGFKLEQDRKGPTMKQKVVFILKNRNAGSNEIKTAKSNVDLIEEKTGTFVRSVYDRSSASTHGAPTREEAISIKAHIALILCELLQVQV